MRLFLHILITITIAATLGGVSWHHIHVRREQTQRTTARAELDRFQRQVHLRMALAQGGQGEPRAPETIDPSWFENDAPTNPLLGPEHPWVEVASPEQRTLQHPPDLVATDKSVASFWYNPATGVIRARVPMGISDAQTLELYNEINDSDLTQLFDD